MSIPRLKDISPKILILIGLTFIILLIVTGFIGFLYLDRIFVSHLSEIQSLISSSRFFSIRMIVITTFIGVVIVSIGLMIFFWKTNIRPLEKLFQMGNTISNKDCTKLTTAIVELGQGNLSEHLTIQSKPLKGLISYELTPIIQIFNNIILKLQNTAEEFNAVTGIPCYRLCFVGADSFLEGQRCGEVMGELLSGKGQVVIVEGNYKHIGHELRRKGFESYIRENHPRIEIIDRFESKRDNDRVYQYTSELFKKYDHLSGIYFTDTESCLGSAKYIQETNQFNKIKIVSHDLAETTVRYIKAGIITSSLSQDPIAQGYNPVMHLYNHLVAGWIPPTPRMLTHLDVITGKNLENFWRIGEGILQTNEILERLVKPTEKRPEKPLRIVVLGREETKFWAQTQIGVNLAAERLKDLEVNVEWLVPEEHSKTGGVSAGIYGPVIEKLIKDGIDGFAIVASNLELVPYINRAIRSGIPVVTWNTEPSNLGSLIYMIKDQAQKLMGLSQNLSSSTFQANLATTQVKDAMNKVYQGTITQNEQVKKTREIIESLLDNINNVNHETEESAKAAESTVEVVSTSTSALENTLNSMASVEKSVNNTSQIVEKLGKHSERIDGIVELINDIASRVNVLALNAAIEATRAGQYGKSFMVVAKEVRKLSKNSAEATREVAELVGAIQNEISKVEKLMGESLNKVKNTTEMATYASESLNNIRQIVDIDKQRLEQIASSVFEMQNFSHQVEQSIDRVASVSEKNALTVEEVNVSTKEMSVQLEEVSSLTQSLENMAEGEQHLLAKFSLTDKMDEDNQLGQE